MAGYKIRLEGKRLPTGAVSFPSKDKDGIKRTVSITRQTSVITKQQLDDLGRALKSRPRDYCGMTIEDFLVEPLDKPKAKPAPVETGGDGGEGDGEGEAGGNGGQGDPPKPSTAKKKTAAKK